MSDSADKPAEPIPERADGLMAPPAARSGIRIRDVIMRDRAAAALQRMRGAVEPPAAAQAPDAGAGAEAVPDGDADGSAFEQDVRAGVDAASVPATPAPSTLPGRAGASSAQATSTAAAASHASGPAGGSVSANPSSPVLSAPSQGALADVRGAAMQRVNRAWCVEAGRVMGVLDAQAAYFAQREPRRRLTFLCADPACRERTQARIQAMHDDRLYVDDAMPVAAAFVRVPQSPHDPDCLFTLREQAADLVARDTDAVQSELNIARRLSPRRPVEVYDVYRPAVAAGDTQVLLADTEPTGAVGVPGSLDEAAARVTAIAQAMRTRPLQTRRLAEVIACYTELGAVDRQKAMIRVPGGKPMSYGSFVQPLSRFSEDSDPVVRVGGARVACDGEGFVVHFHDRVTVGGERRELRLPLPAERIDGSPLAGLVRAQLGAALGDGCHVRLYFFGGVIPLADAASQAEIRLTHLENLVIHPMRG